MQTSSTPCYEARWTSFHERGRLAQLSEHKPMTQRDL